MLELLTIPIAVAILFFLGRHARRLAADDDAAAVGPKLPLDEAGPDPASAPATT